MAGREERGGGEGQGEREEVTSLMYWKKPRVFCLCVILSVSFLSACLPSCQPPFSVTTSLA